MSSPGQKRGSCGHAMAGFDRHLYCACCRDKGKGKEPCISNKDTSDCNALTPEQRLQLATPSYKLKKEKREAKRADANPSDDTTLVDPAEVSVVGVIGEPISQSVSAPPEKKVKKDKAPPKPKKSTESSATDSKISQLDEKWSERFNRLSSLSIPPSHRMLKWLHPSLHLQV